MLKFSSILIPSKDGVWHLCNLANLARKWLLLSTLLLMATQAKLKLLMVFSGLRHQNEADHAHFFFKSETYDESVFAWFLGGQVLKHLNKVEVPNGNQYILVKGFVGFPVCICWQVCPGLIRRWTNDILYIKLTVPHYRLWTQQRIN